MGEMNDAEPLDVELVESKQTLMEKINSEKNKRVVA